MTLLEQHYVEGWTAPTYARILGTTPYLLNRIFVARFGCTAASAIASRRLTEAKRLLFYTDRSVSEIAFDLGYSSPGYFCRLFRVRTGQSPGLWRRERRGRMGQSNA